jgi:hypothetical protein
MKIQIFMKIRFTFSNVSFTHTWYLRPLLNSLLVSLLCSTQQKNAYYCSIRHELSKEQSKELRKENCPASLRAQLLALLSAHD